MTEAAGRGAFWDADHPATGSILHAGSQASHNTRVPSFIKGALCWIFLGGELNVALLNLCVRLLPQLR